MARPSGRSVNSWTDRVIIFPICDYLDFLVRIKDGSSGGGSSSTSNNVVEVVVVVVVVMLWKCSWQNWS